MSNMRSTIWSRACASSSLSGQPIVIPRSAASVGRTKDAAGRFDNGTARAKSWRWRSRLSATKPCSCGVSSQRAQREGYVYYVMEAFDQPWKARYEGAVGAYWGVYDVDRRPKFAFVEPIVRIPEWHLARRESQSLSPRCCWDSSSSHSRTLGTRGSSLLALVVYATATGAVWVVYDYSRRYLTLTSMLIGTFLIVGMITVIALLIAEAHEWAEARWSKARRRTFSARLCARFRRCRSTCRRTTNRRTWSSRRSMRWRGSTIPTTKSSSSTTTRRTRRPGARSSDTARGSARVSATSMSIVCAASRRAR